MAKNKRGKNKKAVFFSLDALIALMIILLTITVIYPIIRYSEKESYVPEDILSSLSALKIGEMDSSQVTIWINDGKITDLNKSVLEQMGEFYVSTDPAVKDMARLLAEEVLLTIKTNENIGIYYGGNLLASQNKTNWEESKDRTIESQTISGIQEGEETTGYSARAFLTNSEQTKYYYFGGYVGEGNITLNVEYNGTLSKIELEIAASKNFTICINEEENGCSGSFEPAVSEFEPKNFTLDAYKGSFNEGKNTFKIIPVDGGMNFHVAGGYLKLTYDDGVQYEQSVRYYFPGISGIINLYDGFYVPGNLNNLEVHVQARVDDPTKRMYMRMGDVLIFNETTDGSLKNIDYDNSEISAILSAKGKSYLDYSNKTIPLRVTVEGVDYLETELIAEIFSSVGLSGSSNSVNVKAIVDGVSYNKIDAVNRTNKKLVELILGINDGAYLGLAPTRAGIVPANMYHPLSQDEASLKSTINDWTSGNTKDICAGIQRSADEFTPESGFRAIILSVFDAPNQCDIWEDEPEFINGGTTLEERIKTRVCNLAEEKNISFYIVEMGLNEIAEINTINALNDIADCSNGKYVDADDLDDGLMDAYKDIVRTIKDLIYDMQIIDVINSANAESYLSPDSYIEFNYERSPPPYGIVISSEKMFDDENRGSFDIQPDSSIVETKIISYSGSRWTKEIIVNNSLVYDLDDYGLEYTGLGDPYAINIPNSFIGSHNDINLTTAITPTEIFPGSSSNKIIYTIVKNMVSYSAISSSANGCIWKVEFEDGDTLTVPIGTSTDLCYYNSTNYERPLDNDALKIAVYNLFKKLDSDEIPNGKINLKFEEQNLQISSSEVTGIPYPWETVVQIRKWW